MASAVDLIDPRSCFVHEVESSFYGLLLLRKVTDKILKF